MSKRIYQIDVVRIVAILGIVVFHFLDNRFQGQISGFFDSGTVFQSFNEVVNVPSALVFSLMSLGLVGVNVFFVVSGFSLAVSSSVKKLNLSQFYLKRLFRLIPLYWIVLLAVTLIYLWRNSEMITWFDFWIHFFGITTFFPGHFYTISPPFWFVSVLIQFYIFFPLLRFLLSKMRWPLFVLGALVVQLFLTPMLQKLIGDGLFFTHFLFEFSVGLVLGSLLSRNGDLFSNFFWRIGSLVGVLVFGCLILFRSWFELPVYLVISLHSLMGISLTVFGLVWLPKNYGGLGPWVLRLSAASYAIFLTHHFFLVSVYNKIPRQSFIIEIPLFVCSAFLVGYLVQFVYSTIEKKLKRLLRPVR